MRSHRMPWLVALTVAALAGPLPASAGSDPWLDRLQDFVPGETAGFGQDLLPWVVLGPPEGLGATQGSLHVVSLGKGGSIVVSFNDNVVVDGPGDDLVIFENAFHAGSEAGPIFTEYAFVEVSADGKSWEMFPYDGESGAGLAGQTPVFAASTNELDPLDVESGGDRFDLSDVGLPMVRFVRLTDAADVVDDYGNHSFPGTKGGFDLDAAAALNSASLGKVWGFVSQGGEPVVGMRVRLRADGETRSKVRRTRADGRYKFARVMPETDYVVETESHQQEARLGVEPALRVDFELP